MNMFTSPSLSKAIQYRHVSASIDIPVRSMDFTFPDEIPEFWFSNNPLLTLLLTALSSAFPDGERQFIHSVRHYQNKIKDKKKDSLCCLFLLMTIMEIARFHQ